MVRIVRIIKQIFFALGVEQTLMGVHPRPVDAGNRLGHKRRVQIVRLRDRFNRVLESHQRVRAGNGIGIPKVDFMLTGRNLVMPAFDFDAELLKREDNVLAHFGSQVTRREIEIARNIVRHRLCAVGLAEEEKFRLGRGVIAITQCLDTLDDTAQNSARIAFERLTIGTKRVADDPRNAMIAFRPRQNTIGANIRHHKHVALENAREPLNRRAVEPNAVFECFAQFVQWNRNVLDRTKHIRQLQTDKLDAICFCLLDQLLLLIVHCRLLR